MSAGHLDNLDRLCERAEDVAGERLLDGTAPAFLDMDPEQVMAMCEEIETLRGEVEFLNKLLDVADEVANTA